MLSKNPQLITAFGNFKEAKIRTSMSEAQQHLLDELNAWTSQTNAIGQHFEKVFETQDKEDLIKDYIAHQDTIEITTKNALKQMVQQKHELENRFQKFQLVKSKVLFTVSAVSLAISVTFAILGLLSLPFGGAGVILLALSLGTATLSFGFLAAGYLHSRHYKPHMLKEITTGFKLKMAWTKLRSAISTYSHRSKEKKLIEVAKVLQKLHQSSIHLSTKRSEERMNKPEYQKALADYQQAKLNFKKSQRKVNYWTERLKKFEARITEAGWKDFAQYASLQEGKEEMPFDALSAFKTALQACNLNLLSTETRSLLEVQLGINLEHLQAQMNKDPEGIKNSLQEFFGLGDVEFVNFLKKQNARMQKGLLRPQFV